MVESHRPDPPRRARVLQRVIAVRPEDTRSLMLATAWLFLLLASYFVLRPIRDAMAVAGGVDNIPELWSGTFLFTLVITPAFASAVTRWPRRRFVPITYHFVAANLLAFFVAWQACPEGGSAQVWLGRAFYVWVSAYVMFVVSVFWSVLADLFRHDRARRTFAFIGFGGTLGTMTGSSISIALSETLGTAGLLLVAAVLLELGLWCAGRLMAGRAEADAAEAEAPPGRGVWQGARRILRSPFLLGIAAYVFLLTYPPTFVYLEKARLVNDLFADRGERVAFFAWVDLGTNALTLVLQALVTARVMQRFGVGVTLCLLPLACVVGFTLLGIGTLGWIGVLGAFVLFDVALGAGRHAIARPAREVLFTLVDRDEKYASKNFIDTVVYRGGDVANSFLHTDVIRALLPGISAVAFAAVPIAAVWTALAAWLGAAHSRRVRTG